MRELVRALIVKAGTSKEHAATMAELLVATDLRGVFSHGTRAATVRAPHAGGTRQRQT